MQRTDTGGSTISLNVPIGLLEFKFIDKHGNWLTDNSYETIIKDGNTNNQINIGTSSHIFTSLIYSLQLFTPSNPFSPHIYSLPHLISLSSPNNVANFVLLQLPLNSPKQGPAQVY
jgi:hypothetical protein